MRKSPDMVGEPFFPSMTAYANVEQVGTRLCNFLQSAAQKVPANLGIPHDITMSALRIGACSTMRENEELKDSEAACRSGHADSLKRACRLFEYTPESVMYAIPGGRVLNGYSPRGRVWPPRLVMYDSFDKEDKKRIHDFLMILFNHPPK